MSESSGSGEAWAMFIDVGPTLVSAINVICAIDHWPEAAHVAGSCTRPDSGLALRHSHLGCPEIRTLINVHKLSIPFKTDVTINLNVGWYFAQAKLIIIKIPQGAGGGG